MSFSKKYFLKVAFISILVFFLIIYFLGKMLTSSLSKPYIEKKLEQATGYKVNIQGDLHWYYTLEPKLMIEKIRFISDKKTSIELKNATISLALMPLLKKSFDVHISFQEWQQNQLHFSNGKAHIIYNDQQLQLNQFHSEFYQGKIEGQALVNLSSKIPSFDIKASTSNTEIQNLLQDLTHSGSLSGKMNLDTHLTSSGTNPEEWIQHLNGDLNINVKNGELNNIHLNQFIDSQSLNHEKQADLFDTLIIKNKITNGLAKSDISLQAKKYTVKGGGDINFSQQTLYLNLNAYYTGSEQSKNIPIPISIKGLIAHPNISLDIVSPIQQYLENNEPKLKRRFHAFLNRL